MQVNIDTNSEAWKRWREEGIGASDVPVIMGLSPFKNPFNLWLEKTGQIRIKYDTANSRGAKGHGIRTEEIAREDLIEKTGHFYLPACFQSDERTWLRASVDCWLNLTVPGAEIKCPTSDIDHMKTKLDCHIPGHYAIQMQAQMYVTGHKEWLYASYFEGDLQIVKLARDEAFIASMLEACDRFWENVTGKAWPMPAGEADLSSDEEIVMLMRRAVDAQAMKREAEEMERVAVAALSNRLSAEKTRAGGFEAAWTYRKGYQEKYPRTVAPSLSLRVRRAK